LEEVAPTLCIWQRRVHHNMARWGVKMGGVLGRRRARKPRYAGSHLPLLVCHSQYLLRQSCGGTRGGDLASSNKGTVPCSGECGHPFMLIVSSFLDSWLTAIFKFFNEYTAHLFFDSSFQSSRNCVFPFLNGPGTPVKPVLSEFSGNSSPVAAHDLVVMHD